MNNSLNTNFVGISVSYSFANIINNTCNGADYYGIIIHHSTVNITKNLCLYTDGISLQYNIYSNITNNYISYIDLYMSESCKIINNTLYRIGERDLFGDGISISYSPYCFIKNNSILSSEARGIRFSNSPFSTIVDNNFMQNGLAIVENSLEKYLSYDVSNNFVNGLLLGYFENQQNHTLIESFGQIFLINCTNFTIQNKNYSNTSIGIGIYYGSNHTLIENICNNNNKGIVIYHAESCTIKGNEFKNLERHGIFLENCSYSNISNNSLHDIRVLPFDIIDSSSCVIDNNMVNASCFSGISLENSPSSRIVNNTCIKNNIELENCPYSILDNNSILDNSEGFSLFTSPYSIISNNFCPDTELGLSLTYSGYCNISFNKFPNNHVGFVSDYSSGCNITGNIFDGGVLFKGNDYEYYNSQIVVENIVNNLPLGYLKDQDDLIILPDVYSQLYLINCSNIIVKDQIWDNVTVGCKAILCNNITLVNNQIKMCNDYGIYLLLTENSTIQNNNFTSKYQYSYDGIILIYSNSTSITSNYCNNLSGGIKLYHSNFCNITDNILEDSFYDSILSSYSSNIRMINNYCNNSNIGIHLYHSSNISAKENIIGNCEWGIEMQNSDLCTIINNQVKNSFSGINNNAGNNNTFHHNKLINNVRNGRSYGSNNTWYELSSKEGNWWSDYNGIGAYPIEERYSDSFTYDIYPIGPIFFVNIYNPSNIIYYQDSILLNYSISKPTSIIIYLDNEAIETALPSGCLLSNLTHGTHNITIFAFDCDGYTAMATILFEIDLTPNSIPVASFTYSLTNGTLEVKSNSTGSDLPLSYQWNFGDGTIINVGTSFIYTYQNNGTYTVSLTVRDSNGDVNQTSYLITVEITEPLINNPESTDNSQKIDSFHSIGIVIAIGFGLSIIKKKRVFNRN